MGQFRATWDEKTKEEVLEDLNKRLKAAEDRVRGKENEIEVVCYEREALTT